MVPFRQACLAIVKANFPSLSCLYSITLAAQSQILILNSCLVPKDMTKGK